MDIQIIGMMVLAFIVIVTLLYALFFNKINNDKKASERIKSMQVDQKTKAKAKTSAMNRRQDEKTRRKARENTLKNVEEQRAAGKKAASPSLKMRMAQAGMTMSMTQYYIMCGVIGFVVFIGVFLFTPAPIYIAAGAAFAAGGGVPYWFVNYKRKKRFNSFTLIFPNAIDVIVRGIRSGLPLNDCLRIIAADAEEPVKGEFRKLCEATQMGISVPDACGRLYDSIPTSETNFFAIVIAIQSSAGGNLSEALGNLSKVLRERRKMADKVQAFSTEAKTSAAIIGSLPFIVAGLVHLSTPKYLVPLFTTDTGNKIILFCAISMGFGIFVMKKMINFKF